MKKEIAISYLEGLKHTVRSDQFFASYTEKRRKQAINEGINAINKIDEIKETFKAYIGADPVGDAPEIVADISKILGIQWSEEE